MALAGLMLLVFGIVAFLLLENQFHRRPPEMPSCFASDPGPQQMAKNDCFSCGWREVCFDVRHSDHLSEQLSADRRPPA